MLKEIIFEDLIHLRVVFVKLLEHLEIDFLLLLIKDELFFNVIYKLITFRTKLQHYLDMISSKVFWMETINNDHYYYEKNKWWLMRGYRDSFFHGTLQFFYSIQVSPYSYAKTCINKFELAVFADKVLNPL